MDQFVETNRRNFAAYTRLLEGIEGVTLFEPGGDSPNFQYVTVLIDPAAGLGRDALQAVLRAENVLARRYFHPGCHRMEPYAARGPQPELPVTDALAARVLCLPTGSGVSPDDIDTICGIVQVAADQSAEVAAVLHQSNL